jgi:2-dehydropantoate 2-reductase
MESSVLTAKLYEFPSIRNIVTSGPMETQTVTPPNRPSFVILGVGAVGGLYGGLLSKAGFDVHFLARSEYQHLKDHGLTVETPTGSFHLTPQVYANAAAMPQVDCVVVCWKSTANRALAEVLPHFEPSQPYVLVLQNGLNIEEEVAQLVERQRVIGGCCFLCANRVAAGHIRHLDYGGIALGHYDTALVGQISPKLLWIGAALVEAGIETQLAGNLAEVRWKKLTWNIPFNGLSVVLSADTAQIMTDPQATQLARRLMEEVAACAKACGQQVGPEHIERMLNETRAMVPYASSMLLDYQAGRAMEVEAIFGNPLRAAQANGCFPERIEMLYQQLSFINRRLKQE